MSIASVCKPFPVVASAATSASSHHNAGATGIAKLGLVAGIAPTVSSRLALTWGAAVALLATSTATRAQCTTNLLPNGGLPGLNGPVYASTRWDPDGAGPLPIAQVFGGSFSEAGSVAATNIAMWDGSTWSALGVGLDNTVLALAVLPNGSLVAGGGFSTSAGFIAQFNGTSWSALGAGMDNFVQDLTVAANGDLIAVGVFTTAGGIAANSVARFNGTSWSALGSGVSGGFATALATTVLSNGDIVVGGAFTTAGGVPANNIARFNGTVWSALGTGMMGGSQPSVWSLTTLANGDLVAGGQFTTAGGVAANRVARFSGTAWSPIGGGINSGTVETLAQLPNGGDIVAGGSFPGGLVRFNGTQWSTIGPGVAGTSSIPFPTVNSVTVWPSGELFAAGEFDSAGTLTTRHAVRWTGTELLTVGLGFDRTPDALVRATNGDVYAGGSFSTVGGLNARNIARWNGSAWSTLGDGMNGSVFALAAMPNGDVVAGGSFTTAGATVANRIARWNGSTWSQLGSGTPNPGDNVRALAATSGGEVIAGGFFSSIGGTAANNIARWNGSSWAALGSGLNGVVEAVAVLANGDIVAGGQFTAAGTTAVAHVALWNGTSWSALGGGLNNGDVFALTVMPNGDIVAGGNFSSSGGLGTLNIARFNGTAWSALGSGTDGNVNALLVLPNGTLVAGGSFNAAGGVVNTSGIARFDGSVWSALAGCSGAEALALAGNGDLLIAAFFSAGAGGQPSWAFARLRPTCAATAASYGTGCNSSAGQMVLVATQLPWIGNASRSVASGFTSNSIGLAVVGLLQQSQPLSNVLPMAGTGCLLLATLETTLFLLPASGSIAWNLPIPNAPSLIGVQVFQQALQGELDLGGNISATNSTNGLVLTAGDF